MEARLLASLVIRASFVGRSITLGASLIGANRGNGSHLKHFVSSQRTRFEPQDTGGKGWINPGIPPPRGFIAASDGPRDGVCDTGER